MDHCNSQIMIHPHQGMSRLTCKVSRMYWNRPDGHHEAKPRLSSVGSDSRDAAVSSSGEGFCGRKSSTISGFAAAAVAADLAAASVAAAATASLAVCAAAAAASAVGVVTAAATAAASARRAVVESALAPVMLTVGQRRLVCGLCVLCGVHLESLVWVSVLPQELTESLVATERHKVC